MPVQPLDVSPQPLDGAAIEFECHGLGPTNRRPRKRFSAVVLGYSYRPLTAALASAVVFALVHPQVAAVPVFAMAFFSALAYERTGWLATPVVAHMTYNGLVVVGAWE